METAKSLNVTPKTLFITAATSALSGNIKPSTITKIATIASNMNY